MSDKSLQSAENKDAKLAMRQNYAAPAVDIYEQDGGLTLVADMPGVARDQLQVDVDQGVLTLEGRIALAQSGKNLFREFVPSGYYRQFRLPEHLNLSQIDAQLQDGVLTLKLPKSAAALPKRIEVKTIH